MSAESLYDAWRTAVGRDGFCAVQRASADPRGVALARMCEAREADRDWLPGWDGTRVRVVDPYDGWRLVSAGYVDWSDPS